MKAKGINRLFSWSGSAVCNLIMSICLLTAHTLQDSLPSQFSQSAQFQWSYVSISTSSLNPEADLLHVVFCFWLIWRPHNTNFLHPIAWLKWSFCATWLSLTHTAAFVLQIHPRCAAFRRGKGSSWISVKFKPGNKRRGCSRAQAFCRYQNGELVKNDACFYTSESWQLTAQAMGVEVVGCRGQTKAPPVWTGWESACARRESASQNVGDGWGSTRPNGRDCNLHISNSSLFCWVIWGFTELETEIQSFVKMWEIFLRTPKSSQSDISSHLQINGFLSEFSAFWNLSNLLHPTFKWASYVKRL